MKKSQAIKETVEETSNLYRFSNQWKYNYFDLSMNAWRESYPTDYWSACHSRKLHMIRTARMKIDPNDNSWMLSAPEGRNWKQSI